MPESWRRPSDAHLIGELRKKLADAGLTGSFLVRDLSDGREIGIDPDVVYPVASLVKVPLAVAVLDRIHAGRLDGAMPVDVRPGPPASGFEAGLSQFRHAARIAVDDLLYLCVAISDNPAADALFALVPPAEVTDVLRRYGVTGIAARHPMRGNAQAPTPSDVLVAQTLAIGAREAGLDSGLPQLDVTRANAGSARAYVDLLEALWRPSAIPSEVAARVRMLMRANTMRQRLGPDFISDASTWSSKTGTLLNLRHEAGVVEHEDGAAYAVAALTESNVPAASQPAAEALMGHVARALHDHLHESGG
ncbi:serine hydrolase [Actinospica sp. MGRD01-02]|uniref:Serine hydrolase n=1 Tax=Actinospica acidithermotolerans TaxID=2828514 RepID=A0A941ED10_9ACTN|nr:serine hydrolase [Actinospica acidithermotolerans]MBR7826779.1 serine hydrolase [Actinospica acidithermotolerans]